MYALASQIENLPIISLQTGEAIAWTQLPVIDMATFDIVAFRCGVPHQKELVLLMANDIRQFASDCLIIDNEDELAALDDIVRLQDILEAGYSPLGARVFTEADRKLGSVEDYTINLEIHRIQKIHVRQSMLRAWLGSSLVIDHAQIIDVTPQRITVREATAKIPLMQPEPIPKPNP